MEQKILFRQTLRELLQLADTQDGRLSRSQIEEMLSHTALSKEQLDMVCSYLQDQRVTIASGEAEQEDPKTTAGTKADTKANAKGNIKADKQAGTKAKGTQRSLLEQKMSEVPGESDTDAAREDVLSIYLKEVESIMSLMPSVEKALFDRAVRGEAAAKEKLMNSYLPVVCDLAGEMQNESIPVEDLIQEGNLALWYALERLEEKDSLSAYQAVLMNELAASMEETLKDYQKIQEGDQSFADKVNFMDEAMRNLAKDLERKASLEELSAYLEMSEEEIRGILRLAGDDYREE